MLTENQALHRKIDAPTIWNMVAATAILFLFVGFLYNRVVCNLGFILAGIYAVAKIKNIAWLFRDRWMTTFMAMSILVVLSDLYYEGIYFFNERGVMKLVLILFPSFIFALSPQGKAISYIHRLVICCMTFSTLYSLSYYFNNASDIIDSYKYSKVMPVLSYGDHIRISWVTVISMVLAVYEFQTNKNKYYRFALIFYIIFQGIFLHYLGSKTGLITLYLSAILVSYYLIPKGKKWYFAVIAIFLGVSLYLAATNIPSLKERVNFMRYDFEHYSKGEYREGLSDAIRYYSLLAGKDIIKANPYTGVGFSRLDTHMAEWYETKMPQIEKKNYFLPSSQFVIYWASGGIIGLIIVLLHLFYPLFVSYLRENIWFIGIFIPAAFSFAYETHLEGQLPIFIYAFFVSWAWYLAYNKADQDTLSK